MMWVLLRCYPEAGTLLANEGDDVKAKFALRQRLGTGFLRHNGSMILWTCRIHTVPNTQSQAPEPVEPHNGAVMMIGHPHMLPTRATLLTQGIERLLVRRGWPTPLASHPRIPPPPPTPRLLPAGLQSTPLWSRELYRRRFFTVRGAEACQGSRTYQRGPAQALRGAVCRVAARGEASR